jgi:hypothetical protein
MNDWMDVIIAIIILCLSITMLGLVVMMFLLLFG